MHIFSHPLLFTDNTTVYFLKDILSQKKRYVPNERVQTLFIPQYKNLSVERILAFVVEKPSVADFLPDELDLVKVPKQFIVNVCAAVLGNEFRNWVHHQVQERNAVMCAKKEMMISMDPEMAAKFRASTHVSLSKGISANLLKDSSKRRRTLRQIKADKEAAA